MSKSREIKEVVVEATAIDDGYYKGRIVKTGEKFLFEGVTIGGKFPLWLRPLKEVEPKKEAKKKSKAEPIEDQSVSDLV